MSVAERLPPALERHLTAAVVRPSVAAIAVATLLVTLLPPLPVEVRYAPFVVSVLLFGLPHGAVDHLVPGRMLGQGGYALRPLLAVLGVYTLLGGLYLVAWYVVPVAAAVFFVLLTWFHWGQGDVYAMLAFERAGHLQSRAERALALVVRGGLPMLVPLVGFPGEYRAVAEAWVRLFAPESVSALAPFFTTGARTGVAVGFLAVTLLSLGAGLWRVRAGQRGAGTDAEDGELRRGWLRDAGEVALLWLFFLLVPPILAIGLYFTLWHALRHIARLVVVDDPGASALAAGDYLGALVRFARDATPATVGALLFFAGLYLAVPTAPGDRAGLLGLYLVGIAVLTLPHVAVVTWMDLRQDVW
ncbi:Brp/Blh family beta-carotene 15,15'-dioxygenase [Salinirubrum litoreum]|uniref:Probable beta-carotene 15,15'-dioxygenase n=1 Tax=Salinirubrum litoreum TaxID=1126234 RepID=A0ABD5REI1_9EURY|nr:Brp/Blh family beta-carotene 15,15'-dioxygenase [Salinirubrum litoreum]